MSCITSIGHYSQKRSKMVKYVHFGNIMNINMDITHEPLMISTRKSNQWIQHTSAYLENNILELQSFLYSHYGPLVTKRSKIVNYVHFGNIIVTRGDITHESLSISTLRLNQETHHISVHLSNHVSKLYKLFLLPLWGIIPKNGPKW